MTGRAENARRVAPALAIVDGGSFVLSYDHRLVEALSAAGIGVAFYGSRTAFNGGLLDAMRRLPNVEVHAYDVSGSVAPRWKGAAQLVSLWWRVWRERHRYAAVNLQFPVLWPVEWLFARALGRRFVFTVHNAVPHGHRSRRHAPTARLARCASHLLFASEATRADFAARYGEAAVAHAAVAPLGLLPASMEPRVVPYTRPDATSSLVYWSTVKPYKGIELFADLARDPTLPARGLGLEVWGRWSPELAPLRADLAARHVRIEDRYLDDAALVQLLERRDVLFVLPYLGASQSGAMYTLLAHGAWFVATDVGDIGAFLRRHGLEALLLAERTPQAVVAALERIAAQADVLCGRLQAAQAAASWAPAVAAYRTLLA